MNDKELKKKCLEIYLGETEEDNILEMAIEWYSNIITAKYTSRNNLFNYNYENVVFITDRSYMLASALETVSGRLMSECSAKIFTASSFCSYYEQLAQWYVEYHDFPKTLLCEDLIYYDNNIRMVIDNLLKNVLKSLKEIFSKEEDIEKIKSRFNSSIDIFCIAKSGYDISCSLVWVETRKSLNRNMRKINDLSNRLSNCVKFMNFSNDTYNCYEVIEKEKLYLHNPNDFIQTIYQNKIESTRIEPVFIDNHLKAILSLRIVQNVLSEESLCVIPFVFLPNLSKNETEDIWNIVKRDIINNEDPISQEFVTHMDYLKELDGKCLFNEYLTLIFNYALLDDFNLENGIDFTHTDLYQQQLETLSRNYNIADIHKTQKYLDAIFQKRYLKKEKLCQLLQSKIHEEKEICRINECGSNVTLNNMEEYWYSFAMNSERVYRLYRKPCITKTNGLCLTLASMFDNHNIESVKVGISNFLQLVDANIVNISCLATSNIEVTGYDQFANLGAMASFIYPNMLKEYIPTLLEMHKIFYLIFYNDVNVERREKDWWVEFVTNYFEIYSSYADSSTIRKIKYFLQTFKDNRYQYDSEKLKFDAWNIDWTNNVNCFNEQMVTSRAIRFGNQLEYKLTRNRCLREFESFRDDEIFGPTSKSDNVKKKLKGY